MTLVFVAAISPMIAYNLHHFGRPFVSVYSAWNLVDGTGVLRVEPWLYYRILDPMQLICEHFPAILRKFFVNIAIVVPLRIWTMWYFYLLIPAAVLGFCLFRRSLLGQRLLISAGVCLLLQLLVFSWLRLELVHQTSPHHGRYYFWFAVPALLGAIGLLEGLVRRHRHWRVLVALVVVLQLGIFASTWRSWVLANQCGCNLGKDPIRQGLANMIEPGQLVASNQPAMLLWYSGLKAISLPAEPSEIGRVNAESRQPIDYIFVDLNFNTIDLDSRWNGLVWWPDQGVSPWVVFLLRDYEYAIPLERTQPLMYALLRRIGVPPSGFELQMRAEASGHTTGDARSFAAERQFDRHGGKYSRIFPAARKSGTAARASLPEGHTVIADRRLE